MEERYPFIRFVVDAAPFFSGALALVVLLGGTLRSCQHGGLHGLVSFALVTVLAAVAYVAFMVGVESLKLLLDIEANGRERLAEMRRQTPPAHSERLA